MPERLTQSAIYQFPSSVTRDGTQVVFSEASDLMLLTMDKDHRVRPLFREPRFGVRNGEISPDGRWLAYEETNKGGQVQISVRPFPDVTAVHYQVSTSGGSRPLWSPNGQELFYLAPSGAVMSVGVGPGASWMRGETTTLFDGSAYAAVADNNQRAYDVSPDGKRFLMIKQGRSDQPATSAGIIVVQNWFEELKRLVPAH